MRPSSPFIPSPSLAFTLGSWHAVQTPPGVIKGGALQVMDRWRDKRAAPRPSPYSDTSFDLVARHETGSFLTVSFFVRIYY
jgi:hypothetical protein